MPFGEEPVDDTAELRMLRAKAYGPDGDLSADELARLQELEGGRLRLPSAARPEGAQLEGAQHPNGAPREHSEKNRGEAAERDEAPESSSGAPDSAEHDAAEPDPEVPEHTQEPRRRRWPVVVAASVGILALGVGVGWGIWGWDSRATALAAAHSDTRAEIEAEDMYDPGTVVPLTEQYGVVVWRADRSDGKELCVILTAPDQEGHGCVPYEQIEDSAWPNAVVEIPEGEKKAGQQMTAGLLPGPDGEFTPFVQTWYAQMTDWESRFSDEEIAQLKPIEEAGFDPGTLDIVGYDGERAVWSTWENSSLCLIASTDDGVVHGCSDDQEQNVSVVGVVDGVATRYLIVQDEMRPTQLTIYKDIDIDYYFGSGDDPMYDDLVRDDDTGS